MQFNTVTTITLLAVLSFDSATGRKGSKSHKQKKCSQVLYFDPTVHAANFQLYPAGPPVLGNTICEPSKFPDPNNPGLKFCSGIEELHHQPGSLFKDNNLTKRVEFVTAVQAFIADEFRRVTTNTIVFDEGSNAGSEIVFVGFTTNKNNDTTSKERS